MKSTEKHKPYVFEPIGIIHTEYKEKFGIPRQPGLAASTRGVIKLSSSQITNSLLEQSCKGLELFSHIWIVFVFHEHNAKAYKATIRPPRLGGKKKMGVLGSRTPHRPNPIGLSAVKLEGITKNKEGQVLIEVSGVDILDGSPVLDIKPYLPYADSIPDANSGWTNNTVEKHPVFFTPEAESKILHQETLYPGLKSRIIETLTIDPRPSSQRTRYAPRSEGSVGKKFGFTLTSFDVKWQITDQGFEVYDLEELVDGKFRKPAK